MVCFFGVFFVGFVLLGFFCWFVGFFLNIKLVQEFILGAKKTAYERCSCLRISPTDVNKAILRKYGMSVPVWGLLLSADFLAGIRLWVAAVCLLFKSAFSLSCLWKGAMFSTEQGFMNTSYQEESSSKVARGELQLSVMVCVTWMWLMLLPLKSAQIRWRTLSLA